MYAWSLCTLGRRLRSFGIYHTSRDVTKEQLRKAVEEEMAGPGRLLGYQALTNKIRQCHDLKVPCRLVHAMVYNINPEGLQERSLDKTKKGTRRRFTTRGTNSVHSLDEHAKLMGFKRILSC